MRYRTVLVASAGLLMLGLTGMTPAAGQGLPELAIGSKAPEFTLKDTDGNTVTLAQLLAQDGVKAVVVEFIATRCPVSNDYDARMVQLYADYKDKGVAIVGINSNCYPANALEDVPEVKAHKAKKGIPFPVLKDVDHKVGDAYGARVTPHMYLLDKQGVMRYIGAIDDSQDATKVTRNYLRDALNAQLAGKAVAVTTTKAFGCTIKRKMM